MSDEPYDDARLGRKAGLFACWQPRYAEHRVPTFPVDLAAKRPRVRGYLKIGSSISAQLALRFPDVDAFGFPCGKRSRITVLDVDTTEERVLADALDRHGPTPFIVRTASGKWHGYYRHNGEGRRIRPVARVPIDILGGGYAVAPPSRGARGQYEIVQGRLDDLDRLPVMRQAPAAAAPPAAEMVPEGRRNTALFGACRRAAARCDDEQELIAFAVTWNEEHCVPPDVHDNVVRTARSAWKREVNGRGWQAREQRAEVLFRRSPDAMALLGLLKARYRPGVTFELTNTYAAAVGWDRKRFARVRRILIEEHELEQLRSAYPGQTALYRRPRQP